MDREVCTILVNNKRLYVDNAQEIDEFDVEYFKHYDMLETVEQVKNINNNNNVFIITEYNDSYIKVVTDDREYSISCNAGLDIMTIYENRKESSSDDSDNKFVAYMKGEIKSIIFDRHDRMVIENYIVDYEKKEELLKLELTNEEAITLESIVRNSVCKTDEFVEDAKKSKSYTNEFISRIEDALNDDVNILKKIEKLTEEII